MSRLRPTVGIIGAGIFGTTCALRLASRYRVTVFEAQDHVLGGASWGNQNRHHLGYHYSRSSETVIQCQKSQSSFDALYGGALVRDVAAYYCVANEGSRTSPEDYLAFCDRHGLPYEFEYPAEDHLRRDKVALSLRVPEPVIDYWELKRLVETALGADPSIEVRLEHEVVGGHVTANGQKRLEVRHAGRTSTSDVDVLINASFYDINTVLGWFGFRRRNFQYDVKELAIVRLPSDRAEALTVMDGPFCTIVPMGRSGRFLLGHVRESVLARDISSETPPRDLLVSRWLHIRDASAEYFPFVRRAGFIDSMFTRIVVDPDSADDDARVSEITPHGHGCWTVFSAKIVSCVAVADEVGREIDAYLHGSAMACPQETQ
jgi:glycine/D-amino acid oxidase-like deaminating enzyme